MSKGTHAQGRPSLPVVRYRQPRGGGITLAHDKIDRRPIPSTTTGAWALLADAESAADDAVDGWVENVAGLLQRHAPQRDEGWEKWAQEHMANFERRARYWPKKDRVEAIAREREALASMTASQWSNATALPTAYQYEATDAFEMRRSVRGGSSTGHTIHMAVVAPDGSEVLRAESAAEPIALAAHTARALYDLADALNVSRGLHLTD